MRPKVGVVGWYGHNNVGDEAYKSAFPKLFPQCDFVFAESPTDDIETWILGGGDVVTSSNVEAFRPLKKKHIMSATVSRPYDLTGFGTVAVRDYRSVETIKSRGAGRVLYVPDFAFALSGDAARGRRLITSQFEKDGADLYSKVVVVVINGYLAGEHSVVAKNYSTFQTVSFQLAEVADNTSASFFFVPFGCGMPTDDRVTNGWVAGKCKFWQKNAVAYNPLSVQDALDVMAAADAVVSTRLHSSVFSCVCGTPFIDVTHNHKNERFLETIEWNEYSADYRGFDTMSVMASLEDMLSRRGELAEKLTAISRRQKLLLAEFAQGVRL
jgi:polysaccharide pyruvyl transferase WcaK-like protein